MAFYVGQKVVCIDVEPRGCSTLKDVMVLALLTKGSLYTVRNLQNRKEGFGLTVCELPPWWYYTDRFRPLVDRPTDISIFTKMLDKTKQAEDA